MKSIIQKTRECYFCGSTENLHDHHIFAAANRKASEKHGLKCWICGWHHNLGGNGECVHKCRDMDLLLKRIAQAEFEKEHSRAEFMKLIGKSYLED